ncbi:MAG: DUF4178 domain-containing protein [Chitinivibrionales bacterium]|nr:DUF4178 domain-containing protein [Chitinivibrionales bacterium]
MNFTIILIVILVAVIVYLLWQASRKNKAAPAQQEEKLSVENAGVGAVMSIRGVGPQYEDIDVIVAAKHVYREGSYSWYELVCEAGGDKYWLEIENDDDLEISITLNKLKLNDLNITPEDLARLDEEESGEITYKDTLYRYEDSGSARYLKNGDEHQAQEFYYWDFESDDGKHFIGVEQWDDDSYEASYSEALSPSEITVYSLRGEHKD